MCALCEAVQAVFAEHGSPVRLIVLTPPGTGVPVPYNTKTRKEQYIGYLACGAPVHFIEGMWVLRSELH